MTVPTIKETYDAMLGRLATLEEAAAEAVTILSHVTGYTMSELQLHADRPCPQQSKIDAILEDRLDGMPLAYALHQKYFFGYPFYVDSRVLIPRWDSECVVQRAIELIGQRGYQKVADLCCGSGALGITLCLETRLRQMHFYDISQDALDVTQKNAGTLLEPIDTQLAYYKEDLLGENNPHSYGLIISNPPYVSPAEYAALDEQIRGYEPQGALLAEEDGYEFYTRIAQQAGAQLAPGGALVLEIGSDQQERVMQLLADNHFKQIKSGNDLAGRPRYVSADWE